MLLFHSLARILLCVCVCVCKQHTMNSPLNLELSVQATSAGVRGDREGVRSNNNLSYGCTIGAIVSGVVGVGAMCGIVFGIIYQPRHYYY